jgi:hypothetical protein
MPTQRRAVKQIAISVENQKSIGVKFRMIIFSTIMGSVYAAWPTKYNSYQA